MSQVEIDASGLSVMIGMPANRDLPVQTVASLLATQCLFQAKGVPLDIEFKTGCSVVQQARSLIANSFLKSACNRLFWVDSDIGWQPEDFLRLVLLSTKMDIVGAIYPAKKEPIRFFINADDLSNLPSNEYGCLSVKGFGLGFTVVSRGVIETLSAKAPKLRFPELAEPIPHMFREDSEDDQVRGEDMAFFADAREAGFPVWLDPTVTLEHIGPKAYSARLSDILTKHEATKE